MIIDSLSIKMGICYHALQEEQLAAVQPLQDEVPPVETETPSAPLEKDANGESIRPHSFLQ
ncbi:MAG TPA: hypothetical protein PLQ82_06730 [Desulfobacteraceae bacterium]|nr:hypothetical protein [Desulfobacteraceae bacterium]